MLDVLKRTVSRLALVVFTLVILTEPAFAGPGGFIAKAVFETFWGRVALAVLTIVFLPLILYVMLKEKISERRSRKDLRFMAGYSSLFDWLKIQHRAKECFYRVHSGWEDEDLSDVSQWMTDWYWQNQQLVHLNRWKKDGLKNVCSVKRITNIRPLFFAHRNYGSKHEGSMIVIAIEANMNDYLEQRSSGKVIEGSKRFKDVETVWTFTLENGEWKVSDIEDGNMSLAYAKLVKDLPNIESTLMPDLKA